MKKILLLLTLLCACQTSPYLEYNPNKDFKIPKADASNINIKTFEKESEIDWKFDFGPHYLLLGLLENKKIFVFFYQNECLPCYKMVKDVLSKEKVITELNDNFYSFRVNQEELDEELTEIFGVEMTPMVLIIHPNRKNPIELENMDRLMGYHSEEDLYEFLLKMSK